MDRHARRRIDEELNESMSAAGRFADAVRAEARRWGCGGDGGEELPHILR
jgi:hypothetical protein